jgi:excisionase family DNA binding protein
VKETNHSPAPGQPSFQDTNLGGRYITKQELAKYLSCSTRQVEKLVARGILPIRKLGKRMARFSLARCEAALAKYDVCAIGEDSK